MKNLLKQFGLQNKEISAYLWLLEMGAQPVSTLAKQLNTARSSMYLIIERLVKSGLVEEFPYKGIKYVKCIEVQNLPTLIEAKQSKLNSLSTLLQEKLPELEQLENKLSVTARTKFHEGKEAVAKMYKSVLEEESFLAFQNPEIIANLLPETAEQIPENIKKSGQEAKEILVNSPKAQEYKQKYHSKTHQIRILPAEKGFESDTIITKDKIYMISYDEKEISALEIWNSKLAQTQRTLFDIIWPTLSK